MYCSQILNYFVANPTNGLNIVTATTVFENEFKFKMYFKQSTYTKSYNQFNVF